MKLIRILIVFFLITTSYPLLSLNFITTAESISWSGAYTSIADGFESMLYNPAGLFMTDRRFGINVWGSYGFRVYNNSLTTDTGIKLLQALKKDGDITDILAAQFAVMPDVGLDAGFDMSLLNVMTYAKMKDFSIGVSVLPKTYFNAVMSKTLLQSFLQKLDITSPISIKVSTTLFQYMDFNFNLSTKARFLEKYIKVKDIFVGMTGHFYLPTMFVNMTGTGVISAGTPQATIGYVIPNIDFKGDIVSSGIVQDIYGYTLANTSLIPSSGIPQVDALFNSILNQKDTWGLGFGIDLGFIVAFNKYIKLGFSVTDLGFFAMSASKSSFEVNTSIDQFPNALLTELDNLSSVTVTNGWMPSTAMRTGVAITPFENKYFDFLLAADVSLSDFNRLLNSDFLTFNFAIGVEFTPKYNWFQLPLRAAFSYNTQANMPSFSFGTGLYLGPVEMELAVKGLEALITGLGAKEFCFGFDFKFEF